MFQRKKMGWFRSNMQVLIICNRCTFQLAVFTQDLVSLYGGMAARSAVS